jgi:hypothetical protein
MISTAEVVSFSRLMRRPQCLPTIKIYIGDVCIDSEEMNIMSCEKDRTVYDGVNGI